MNPKLYTLRSLMKLVSSLKKQGKRIVFTNGCFDILHAGHVDYLTRAKSFGDFLVVGLNSDKSVRAIKGLSRPINHEKDRAVVLGGLAAVDAITFFNDETPFSLIMSVRPDVLVKGSDWKVSDIAGAREVLGWGGQVRRVKLLKGRSTSATIRKMSTAAG